MAQTKYLKFYEVYDPEKDESLAREFYLDKIVDLSKLPFPIKEESKGKWIIRENVIIEFPRFPEIDYPVSGTNAIFASKNYLSREKLKNRIFEVSKDPIYILSYEGKDYLLSGHHKYAAALKRGDDKIKAQRVSYLG